MAKRQDLARYPLPGADAAWHYLTGPATSLHQIADAVGFRYRYDPLLKQFLHPAGLVFLNAAGADIRLSARRRLQSRRP